MKQHWLLIALILSGFLVGSTAEAASRRERRKPRSSFKGAVTFTCQDSEEVIRRKGGSAVRVGKTALYIGYRQVSKNNKDPIVARFQNGAQVWCRDDYETSNDDGTGYGLLWDGRRRLYAVFSATGTQGAPERDYRRAAKGGWLPHYGVGGGPKVSVLVQLNPKTGSMKRGTFLTALLKSGKSNSVTVTRMRLRRTSVIVKAQTFYSPRKPDKTAMTCEGQSPFATTYRFAKSLTRLKSSKAVGCH